MSSIFATRHRDQEAIRNADEVELEAIRVGDAIADAGSYDERLVGIEVEEAELDRSLKWEAVETATETEIGDTGTELARRQRLLGDSYPFRLINNNLTYIGTNIGFYEYCLATCFSPSLTRKPYVALPRSFERTAMLIIRDYMGSGSSSMHTGHPRDKENGTTFRSAMSKLSARSSAYLDNKAVGPEWRWDPDPDYPKDPKQVGDRGIDFIVWKQPPDKRLGQLFLLGQCACGNDWYQKYDDIKLDRLSKWFRPMTRVAPPTRCFTTPHVLSDGHLGEATTSAGWVFDRLRLAMLERKAADEPDIASWKPRFGELFKIARTPIPEVD